MKVQRKLLRIVPLVACVAIGSMVAACGKGDAAGPTVTVTPASVARHVDSLYLATGNTDRQEFLTFLEIAPAFGANPAVVRVTVGGSLQFWKAYVWDDVAGADSTSVMIAYSDPAVAMGLFLSQSTTGGNGVALLVDSVLTTVTTSSFSITHGAPHDTCTLATGLTNPALVTAEQNLTCDPATFTVAADLQVPGVLNGDPGTTENLALSIPSTTGVRLHN
jgi:hypothetical protein